MAWVEKHYAQWDDFNGTTHEIKLLQDGAGAGTTLIPTLQPTPCTIKRRGGKTAPLKKVIMGSELEFRFIVESADIATFDAIFESEYKEWKIEHYYNSVLDWVGWLQPQNYSRIWIKKGDIYQIKLSATDGLANLKSIEFVDFNGGAQYTDRVSIIETIQRALEHNELSLDFRVQLGTWCSNTGMTASNCALDKVDVDNSRYTKTKDGREVNEDCYTIIEKVLKDFNVYLIQADAKYWIVNPQEIDSYYFPITWSGLTVGSRTANDLTQSLSGYQYTNYGQLQNIDPFETVEVTFKDRNVQDNLLSNGDFSSASTSEWTASADVQTFDTPAYGPNYELRAIVNVDLLGVPSATPKFYSDAETIDVRSSGDQLQVTYKLRCVLIDMDAGWSGTSDFERTSITCQIRKGSPTGDIISSTSGGTAIIGNADSTYTTYTHLFPVSLDDDYYIEFLIDEVSGAWSDYDEIDVRFDDINFVVIYADGSDLTFDKFYKVNNTDSVFTGIYEADLFFGDSVQDSDIGGYQISGTRTETWNRYGKTESISIQKLYGQNLIENYGQYKDYLRLNIWDPDNNIKPYSILNTDSKNYQIVSHTFIYGGQQRTKIKCELVEVLNTAVTTSITSQQLTSIDGQSSGNSTTPSQSTPSQNLQEVTDIGASTNNEITVPSIQVTSAAQIRASTGSFGSIEIDSGGTGGWEGYSIGGRVVFMHDNTTNAGIYDDINDNWMIRGNPGSWSGLYENGSEKLRTNSAGITVTGALRATGEVESWDTSDITIKSNITELNAEKVTEALMKLRCIRYLHKTKHKNEIGLIAQEVQQYFPELVRKDESGILMIQYGKMIPVLLTMIQQQEKRLLKLEISIFTKLKNWFKKWL